MKKIVIIADDLTGANDTGVQLAKQGWKTMVILKMEELKVLADSDCEVIVLDTESRPLAAAAAYREVARAARLVKDIDYKYVYKKVDSTLRGNLGAEIDAIMDECGFELAIVAPAFPQTGRTTINGIHLLKGVPLEDTEIARYPQNPVTESDIAKLLAGQTKRKVGHLGIKEMRLEQDALARAIAELRAEDVSVISADIWQDEQFSLLADAASEVSKSILWVGSAGLVQGKHPRKVQTQTKPVLVVAGSLSKVTREQVNLLAKDARTDIVTVNTVKLLETAAEEEIANCVSAVQDVLAKGRDAVLTSAYDENMVTATKELSAKLGLSAPVMSDIIGKSIGKIVTMVMETKPDVAGLVLTGGDIAIGVCQTLGAYGIQVESEVAPAIPLGFLQGGNCHSLPVVTKAGAFGDAEALKKAVDALKVVHSK
jgi:uncharacterized protein YgbK (DUF1537 family)